MTDGSGGTIVGRPAGFHIASEYETDYSYDTYGRLDHVTGPGLDSTNGVLYTRVSNSELIADVEFKNSSDATLAKIHRQFESNRDMLDYVENTVTGSPDVTVSKYDYTTDDLGRRTNVLQEGSAFTQHNLVFGYNDRNELTSANRWQGTDQTNHTGVPYAFEYVYDPIGNRETFNLDEAANPTAYTRNSVNQYTATVYPTEAFSYDADGNMTQDGIYKYTYNAENRLIEVCTRIELGSNPSGYDLNDKKVEYKYDYMNRRVEKIYSTHNGSAWVEQTHERFVYDGWNVVMVLNGNASDAIQGKYTWGLDMSGSLQGAGGIGGLLAWQATSMQDSPSFWYFYDGNGNVGQLLKASDQSTAATYEYDPYGNVIVSSGMYAEVNPFRFSTKWFDDESGLGYWGFRYYSPRLGRWMSRDPIGETGAMLIRTGIQPRTRFIPRDNIDKNGYASFLNNAISWFDPDGGEATTQPASSPASQSTPEGYLDPATRLGAALVGQPTTCGIYVIRDIVGIGHTFILWDKNGIGWSGKDQGPNGGRDIQHVTDINKGNPFVAWAVDYYPKTLVAGDPDSPGTHTERYFVYKAGEPKGKCCPDKPNCNEIKQCLEGLIGTPHGLPKPWGPPYHNRANCSSFAHQALRHCCLDRGKVLVDPGIWWNPLDSRGGNWSWWWVNNGWRRISYEYK